MGPDSHQRIALPTRHDEGRKTVIIGLGNTLLGDEGVGVAVARRLSDEYAEQPGIRIIDGGTLSFTLAPELEASTQVILIDAAQLDAVPGTVQVFENDAMDEFISRNRKTSVHEISLMDLFTVAQLTGDLPERRALIAVQPAAVEWSDQLTRAVQDAVDVACARIRALLSAAQ